MDDVQSLVSCINTYCAWYGQMVSIEKSGAFYSREFILSFKSKLNICGDSKLFLKAQNILAFLYFFRITGKKILVM